ncbi:MAG: TspO/MBR family protein [Nocardioides sp.]
MSWTAHLRRTVPPVLAAAVVGGIGTRPTSAWYRSLDKPSWQPPAWVFGPVWTALYASIAVGTARAMEEADEAERRSLERQLWANMALNAGWCWLFFTAQRPKVALAEIAVLEASTLALTRRVPALAPYAAWNGFATALNASIARRN